MGCPDWPKCFGSWVPPTSVDQLPSNYKETYAEGRLQKNKRVSKMFTALGFTEIADRLLNDPSVYEEADFNATKTLIEYLNRLFGALVGLFIAVSMVLSIRIRQKAPSVFWLSLFSVVLVLFQGWLGSIVVSANLMPFTITIHMVMALVLVMLLGLAYHRASAYTFDFSFIPKELLQDNWHKLRLLKPWLWVLLGLFFIQVILGTQVREEVDRVLSEIVDHSRIGIIEKLDEVYILHRSFSWIIVAFTAFVTWRSKLKVAYYRAWKWGIWAVPALVFVEMFLGVIMAWFHIPPFAQPLHLFFGSLIVGIQWSNLLVLQRLERKVAAHLTQAP